MSQTIPQDVSICKHCGGDLEWVTVIPEYEAQDNKAWRCPGCWCKHGYEGGDETCNAFMSWSDDGAVCGRKYLDWCNQEHEYDPQDSDKPGSICRDGKQHCDESCEHCNPIRMLCYKTNIPRRIDEPYQLCIDLRRDKDE